MKKLTILFAFISILGQISAQEIHSDSVKVDSIGNSTPDLLITSDSVRNITPIKEEPIKIKGEVIARSIDRYKIYPTPNMYNFLKLDTMTGRIYRVQWSFEDNKQYETCVNYDLLVSFSDDWVNGRFEIYLTTNIYNFLLLDKIDGRVWHGQWGFESGKTWIERIY